MRALLALSAASVAAWAHSSPVTAVAMSRDGARVATGHADGSVRLLEGSRVLWRVKGEGQVGHLVFGPDGNTVVACASVEMTWRPARLIRGSIQPSVRTLPLAQQAAFSPDGKTLALAGPVGVQLVDPATGMEIKRLGLGASGSAVAFSSDGAQMVAAAGEGVFQVRMPALEVIRTARIPRGAHSVGFSGPDFAALNVEQGILARWDASTGLPRAPLQTEMQNLISGAIASDGSMAAVVSSMNEFVRWDLVTGAVSRGKLTGGYANALAIQGGRWAIGTFQGSVAWRDERPAQARAAGAPSRAGPGATPARGRTPANRPDVMYNTTIHGVPVRVVQVDLLDARVRVGLEVASGFPNGQDSFDTLVRRSLAEIAITGTFFDTSSLRPIGDLVVGGNLIHEGLMGTVFALSSENEPSMRRVPFGRRQDWSGYQFVLGCGPALVLDGRIDVAPWAEGFRDPAIFRNVLRLGLGYTEDWRMLLVATGDPLSFTGFARVMQGLGCTHAMNLDAGSSRALYYRGQTVIRPGRRLTNILTVDISD